MKILFGALHFGLFRNFESVICRLAEGGHQIHLLADDRDGFGGQALAEDLAARYPGQVTWGWAPSYAEERWFPVARKLRQGLDYLRFLEAPYASFPKLYARLAERVPRALLWALRLPLMNTRAGRRLLRASLVRLEEAMPRNPAMDRFLASERPDVVLLASVTNPRTPQLDHLRSARALGIPTGLCVYSWDHLSSKALIRVLPDRVLLWNETQKAEAVELHGVPSERIVVTGAQCYDQVFGWRPNRSRAEFCQAAGLPPERPYLLYVCSALTPDPRESEFVCKWLRAIRQSGDRRLRDAGILIRPHPERREEWTRVDLAGLEPLVVHGQTPISRDAKTDYYDALFYSGAVVGVVTSAFLEAAIAERPVLTVLWPELWVHQEGMLHFRYLLNVEGGLLQVTRSLDEHVAQLAAALAEPGAVVAQQRRFLQAFVRPHGLDVAATPIFAKAVEDLGQLRPVSASDDTGPRWAVALASRLVAWHDRGLVRPLLRDLREHAEEALRTRTLRRKRLEKRRHLRRHRWARVRLLVQSSDYRREKLSRLLRGPQA